MTKPKLLKQLCRIAALGLAFNATTTGAYPTALTGQGGTQRPWSSEPVGNSAANPFASASAALPLNIAHAILVKANPEKESVVTDVPEEILLIFNDGVGEEYLALAVVDESGKRVDKHDAKLDFTDRSHLRASVEKLPPGRYMVRYRVLSADGHVVSGKYYFQVQGKQ